MKTTLLFILLLSPQAFAADENCDPPGTSKAACEVLDSGTAALRLKSEEIKRLYSDPAQKKSSEAFQRDVAEYLTIHRDLKKCPEFQERCPNFAYNEYLNGKDGIRAMADWSSYGANCNLGKPTINYETTEGTILAYQVGSSLSFKIVSDCGGGESLSFVAYKEGLLVAAGTNKSSFLSHAVGRRIIHGPSEVGVTGTPDGQGLRVSWKTKSKEHWIELDASMRFRASSFMKVDQINSGTCKVVKQVQPAHICEGMRKELLKRKQIKAPSDYECMEYVPVIEGIPSKISRG